MKILISPNQNSANDINVNTIIDESKFRKLQAENSTLKNKIKGIYYYF